MGEPNYVAEKRRLLMNSAWQASASEYFCVSDMLSPVYVDNLALAFHVECLQRYFVTRK